MPWRGRWDTEGGGPTMGHGIHQFDLLLAMLGPWSEVTAMAGRLARHVDTEDVSMAIVRFESGAMATITNSLLSPRETSDLRFDTEAATIELSHLYGYADADWTFTPAKGRDDVGQLWQPDPTALPSGHLAQLVPTYRAFAAGEAPPVTVADARGTLELVAAIYRSAFTGAVVGRARSGPGTRSTSPCGARARPGRPSRTSPTRNRAPTTADGWRRRSFQGPGCIDLYRCTLLRIPDLRPWTTLPE